MKLFSFLEANATLYELAMQGLSLNYRLVRRILREEGFFAPRMKFLDVGCGTGVFRNFLRGEDYLGVDINPQYLAHARRRRGDCFLQASVLELSRLSRQSDRILCIGLFHHLNDEEVGRALTECSACLTPHGEIFILDALWPETGNPIGRFLRQSDNGAFIRRFEAWRALFEAGLAVRQLRVVRQWPFDYVFVRGGAKPHCGSGSLNSTSECPGRQSQDGSGERRADGNRTGD